MSTTEAPPPPARRRRTRAPRTPIIEITLDNEVTTPVDGAVAEATPGDIVAAQPPDEPPPPPERTRFRQPDPSEGEHTPPGVPQATSSYLDYLPGIYHSNQFLGRFLLIFESILSPLNRTAENIHHYFDPFVTPPEAVDWLGAWLGLVLDERWPEERRRDLIARAADLYQWRGTKYGLGEFLRLYTGIEPEIEEPTLRDIANNRSQAYRFTVRLRVPQGSAISRPLIESIIDAEKPAFSACTLEIIEA